MTENARNTAVGLLAILALGTLAAMVLLFAGMPGVFQDGWELNLNFAATADAHAGDPVHLAGIRVGKIKSISFADGDPRKGVDFVVQIEPDVRIPGDVGAYIYTRGLAGGAYVQLAPGNTPWIDPSTGKPVAFLPTDGSVTLQGELKTGMIPDDIKAGLENFSKLAQRLNDMLGGTGPAPAPGTQPSTQAAGGNTLGALIGKLNAALDNINSTVNEENRKNLRDTLANLAKASKDVNTTLAEANKTLADVRTTTAKAGGNFETLSRKLILDAEKLSVTLDGLNRVVVKIDTGGGTAGKMLNDPQLYNNLVEATDQMTRLVVEMRQLTAKWKAQGVKIELK